MTIVRFVWKVFKEKNKMSWLIYSAVFFSGMVIGYRIKIYQDSLKAKADRDRKHRKKELAKLIRRRTLIKRALQRKKLRVEASQTLSNTADKQS